MKNDDDDDYDHVSITPEAPILITHIWPTDWEPGLQTKVHYTLWSLLFSDVRELCISIMKVDTMREILWLNFAKRRKWQKILGWRKEGTFSV